MKNPGLAFLLIFAIPGIHSDVALGARWSETGTGLPPGAAAAVAALSIDRQSGTLYARTRGESLFKSTDSGANWKALSNIAGVRFLALDPTSESTIYAGTARGVLRSTNAGESWRSAGLSDMYVFSLAVDPITPSTVYAGAGRFDYGAGGQIYKSIDSGENWTPLGLLVNSLGFAFTTLIVDPLTPSTLYVVSGYYGSTIYKSTDGGESWNVLDSGSWTLLTIDPMTPSTLYAVRLGSGLFKSTDGGASWNATGLTKSVAGSFIYAGSLTIDPRDSNILYATTSAGVSNWVTYKSMDGGNSWNAMKTSFPSGLLTIDPVNSSTFYAVTFGGVMSKSNDARTNWSQTNTGLRVLDTRVLVGDPVDPATVYVGGDESLFKSVDGGGSWNKSAAGVRSMLIDFTNPNILYVVATQRIDACYYTENLLFKSTDGGGTWNNSVGPKLGGCAWEGLMGMDPADPNILYFRQDYDGWDELLKSTDGGANWDYTGPHGADVLNVLAIGPVAPATLYAGTLNGVFKSIDGGAKWNLTGLAQTNVNLVAIDPVQANIVYAATTGANEGTGFRGLFKSIDSGASWTPINNGLADVLDTRARVNALILDPNHTDTLYLGTSGYGVFKSLNGGATWAPFNHGLTHLDVRRLMLVRGAPPIVYASTPGGVFKIEDGGRGPRKRP